MSIDENHPSSSDPSRKRSSSALQLGPRKKAQVFFQTLTHCFPDLSAWLGLRQIPSSFMDDILVGRCFPYATILPFWLQGSSDSKSYKTLA
jgi:hypothetical protein